MWRETVYEPDIIPDAQQQCQSTDDKKYGYRQWYMRQFLQSA